MLLPLTLAALLILNLVHLWESRVALKALKSELVALKKTHYAQREVIKLISLTNKDLTSIAQYQYALLSEGPDKLVPPNTRH